jgi:low temperature requirement protein LtrA
MNNDWYKYFNYGTIILVAVLLILVLTNTVPKDFYVPILVFTIVIFILRIIARVYYSMQLRKKNREG